jgi:hypothetical protein
VTTTYIQAADAQGLSFKENGGTEVMSISDAGAVTVGQSITTGTINADSTTDASEASVQGAIVADGGIDCAKTIIARGSGIYCYEGTGLTSIGKQSGTVLSLNDDAISGLTMSGFCSIVTIQTGGGQSGCFFVSYLTSTVVALANPDSYFDITNVDNNKIAIYKSTNTYTFSIRNYTGSTQSLRVVVIGTTI